MAELSLLPQSVAIILCLLVSRVPPASSVLRARETGGGCIASERAALLSFKAGLSDPGNRLSSWQGEDCCRWEGVRCSSSTGHVVELRLAGPTPQNWWELNVTNWLGGEISPSLLGLRRLRYLDLSQNDFNQTGIPGFLGSLQSLRYLNLSSAGFAGRIPPQLGNISKLVYLDLSSADCTYCLYSDDLAWISHLSSLKQLDLSYVRLQSKAVVHAVNMLPSLKVLRLTETGLSNTVRLRHSNLTALEVLDISDNSFDTMISPQLVLEALEEIHLGENHLGSVIPSNWKNLCNLKVLDLSSLNITRDIAELREWLPRCSWNKLQQLDLSSNNFYGELPHWLTGTIPSNISALIALKNVNFSWNNLSGRMPENIGDLNALESLDLSHNELSGEIPSSISALTSLSRMNLSYNNLSGRIPTGNQLQVLDNPASIYIGNVGLCGPPLANACPGTTMPNYPEEKQDEPETPSFHLSMIIGFIVGLWVVFCTMLFSKRWRNVYFFFVDDSYDRIFKAAVASAN